MFLSLKMTLERAVKVVHVAGAIFSLFVSFVFTERKAGDVAWREPSSSTGGRPDCWFICAGSALAGGKTPRGLLECAVEALSDSCATCKFASRVVYAAFCL